MKGDFFVARIIVFNNDLNRMENYYRNEAEEYMNGNSEIKNITLGI